MSAARRLVAVRWICVCNGIEELRYNRKHVREVPQYGGNNISVFEIRETSETVELTNYVCGLTCIYLCDSGNAQVESEPSTHQWSQFFNAIVRIDYNDDYPHHHRSEAHLLKRERKVKQRQRQQQQQDGDIYFNTDRVVDDVCPKNVQFDKGNFIVEGC